MIQQFFANLWYRYFSNDGKITTVSKSSWFLDFSWLAITLIAYFIANPDKQFANSIFGWCIWVAIGKVLSPLVLIPFASQLKTTWQRLLKGAFYVVIPSLFVFLIGSDKVVKHSKSMVLAKGSLPLPPTDKAAHFGVSFFLMIFFTFGIGLFYNHPIAPALFITLILGLLKESYDEKNGGRWDNRDLLANALGFSLALVYLILQIKLYQ